MQKNDASYSFGDAKEISDAKQNLSRRNSSANYIESEWKFNAIGSGFKGGLAALGNHFGISI